MERHHVTILAPRRAGLAFLMSQEFNGLMRLGFWLSKFEVCFEFGSKPRCSSETIHGSIQKLLQSGWITICHLQISAPQQKNTFPGVTLKTSSSSSSSTQQKMSTFPWLALANQTLLISLHACDGTFKVSFWELQAHRTIPCSVEEIRNGLLINGLLVGGWTNPFEKYARQNGFIFPKVRGENKTYLKPPRLLNEFSNKYRDI